MTPKYTVVTYAAKQTATMLRAELKRHFPGVKFSVRVRKNVQGYHSLSVGRYHGSDLSLDAVRAVTDGFKGSRSDLSDGRIPVLAWVLNGEIIGKRSEGSWGVEPMGLIPPHDDAELVDFGVEYIL